MHKRIARGFTLIELLVVIAIIGILSTVVLVLLSTPRSRGQDAAIISDLSTIQTEAQLYYDTYSSYYGPGYPPAINQWSQSGCPSSSSSMSQQKTMFYADVTIRNAILDVVKNNGGPIGGSAPSVACGDLPGFYAVEAKLKAGVNVKGTTYYIWCVDSSGAAGPVTTNGSVGTGLTSCPP